MVAMPSTKEAHSGLTYRVAIRSQRCNFGSVRGYTAWANRRHDRDGSDHQRRGRQYCAKPESVQRQPNHSYRIVRGRAAWAVARFHHAVPVIESTERRRGAWSSGLPSLPAETKCTSASKARKDATPERTPA